MSAVEAPSIGKRRGDRLGFSLTLPATAEVYRVRELAAVAHHRKQSPYCEGLRPEEIEAGRLWPTYRRYYKAIELGIPRALWTASLDEAEPSPLIDRARRFVTEDVPAGRALVTAGPVGVGKSFAAAAARLELPLPPDHPRERFVYFPGLCRDLLDRDRRDDALELARMPDLVVFDDLGVEYLKAGGLLVSLLDEIFTEREAERRPTWITTNLKPKDLGRHVGARILDRLAGAWGSIFLCPGASRRRQGTAAEAPA